MRKTNISDSDLQQFLGVFLKAPMHVMFNTTYYCDNMCPHCHYSCSPQHDLKKFMPEQDIFAILARLADVKFKVAGVNFSGGEVTAVESINPGYIKRIAGTSIGYGFSTKIMTNGSFINKPYADRVLNDIADLYTGTWDSFSVQMSFDRYHKDCITNAHKFIDALDIKLNRPNIWAGGQHVSYPFTLFGFFHDPDFRDNLNVHPRNIDVYNELNWDLNPVGRAKENNLPNCRDTKTEFEKLCGDNKLEKLIFTPLFPSENGIVWKILITFDCNGIVHLADAHNPDNLFKFVTKYKKPNGEYKTMPEIQAELGTKLIEHVYGKSK